MLKQILVGLVGVTFVLGMLATYHHFVVAPKLRIAVVDVNKVVEDEKARFIKRINANGATPDSADAALKDATSTIAKIELGLKNLAAECDCLLLHKAAVPGARADSADLTERLSEIVGGAK